MKILFVKQFVDEVLGNSSYLIASEETGLAAVIDPQRDVEKYLKTAEGLGLKITYALDTHLHSDFVSGAHELAHHLDHKHTHKNFEIGVSTRADAQFEHLPLREGSRLPLGNLSIGVIETPGHTPEHIAFGVYKEKSETPDTLFSGGSLIVGGTGRPDLLGHEHTIPLARQLYDTLNRKIGLLPDEVAVYPTHGAGSFCNTSSNSQRFTTIGQEKLNNPFLQISDEEEFVHRATTGLANYPTYYRYLRAVNQKGGRVLGCTPILEALSPRVVREKAEAGAAIVDVRATPHYLKAHIENSYGIPLITPLSTWAGWVIPFGTPIILVGDTSAEREEAALQLIRIGYDNLCGYLAGGVQSWQESGLPVVSTKSIDAMQLKDWLGQKDVPTVLDVRYNKEWYAGHIPGAKHIEAGALPQTARALLQEDLPLVVHCQRGNRSTVALSILEQKGYRNIYALDDGIQSWIQTGYELVVNGNKWERYV